MGVVIAVAAALLLGGGLLWWFLRDDRESSGGAGIEDGRTRVAPDGFFVLGYRVGLHVRWRARVDGVSRSGVAVSSGMETFVYTGGMPTDIEILGFSAAAPPVAMTAPPSSSSSSSSSDDDSPFSGFPSAY